MGETILSGGDTSTLHQAGDIGEDEHFVLYALWVQRHWTFFDLLQINATIALEG